MAWDIVSTIRNSASAWAADEGASGPQYQLFRRSHLRLAIWYTGVMSSILTLLSLGVYQAIDHAHKVTLDREIKSVAEATHDAIESNAAGSQQLRQVSPQLLPELCVWDEPCIKTEAELASKLTKSALDDPFRSQQAYQYDYYIRIISPAGELLATAGNRPEGLATFKELPQNAPVPLWQTLADVNGVEYHQTTLPLENDNREIWAYLSVGRSFQDFDQYLSLVRWSLLMGLLLSLALVTAASWWLAALAMRPIYQSYQQIQRFTADAAHELRTPLAAVRATVESVLVMPKVSEEEAHETLKVVHRQNQRLTTLVSDLLLLSRLDSEKKLPTKSICNLQDIISDIVEEMAAFAVAEGVTLAIDFQTEKPLAVLGNEEQLYRLVLNLVNNAITYTPEGGQVSVTLKRTQEQALILVSDTGIGIAPEHQAKIFDRFYRVDESRTGQSGSSGLGLAIAQAIAKAHHGTLTVESQLGKGSTFVASLPSSTQVANRCEIGMK